MPMAYVYHRPGAFKVDARRKASVASGVVQAQDRLAPILS
jgi:hypothetical protein